MGGLNLGTYCNILPNFITKSDTKVIKFLAFTNSSGVALTKTYYLSQVFQADWVGAYNLCKDSEMELLQFNDVTEQTAFSKLCTASLSKFRPYTQIFIGGIATAMASKTSWYWFDSGVKMDTSITWATSQPDNKNKNEYCLALLLGPITKKFAIADVTCYGIYDLFVCQDVKPT